MRLVGMAAVAICAVAAAALWENDRGQNASRSGLLAAWKSVGGSLAAPSLQTVWNGAGLECFSYRGTPAGSDSIGLCFDPDGRLVEALHGTADRVSLISVAATPSRAPVRLSGRAVREAVDNLPASVREAVDNFAATAALQKLGEDLAPAFYRCTRSVFAAYRRLGRGHADLTNLRRKLTKTAQHCTEARAVLRASASGVPLSPDVSALVDRLANLAASLTADARAALRQRPPSIVAGAAAVRREFATRSRVLATLRQIRERPRLPGPRPLG
jgi:hypothetical protein